MQSPVFESPQADLLPDSSGDRYYANVSNKMEVVRASGDEYHVAVAVPTVLFTLMKTLDVPATAEVTLSLDEDERGGWLFSMFYGETLYDLWRYTRGTVPPWIFNPVYRLPDHL